MYGVGIIQADGLRELERNINRGTAGDLYPGTTNNTNFTATSYPSSGLHLKDNNGNPASSNITIMNITQLPDSTIEFDFGGTPTASFKPSSLAGCSPMKVSFTNQSVFSTSYAWDLGNGKTSTETNPNTVYDTAGTYTISLIVYDETNAPIDTFVKKIVVQSSPTANATYTRTDSTVSFINKSTGAEYYSWRFGAMNSQAINPVFTFKEPVTYTLIAYSSNGCTDTVTGNIWYNGLTKPEPVFTAIQIFPNPVKDVATLSFQVKTRADITLSIMNVLGQEVYTKTLSDLAEGKHQLDLNTAPLTQPGVYFIKLKTEDQESVQRFLKE